MLDNIVHDLRHAPERLNARRQDLTRRLRTQVRTLRGDGEERIWTLQTRTLERVGDWLHRNQDTPVVARVAPRAEELVRDRLDTITRPPVPGFEDLNAKDAIRALRGLDRVDLLKVERFERANRNRKTVLEAIEAETHRARQEEAGDLTP